MKSAHLVRSCNKGARLELEARRGTPLKRNVYSSAELKACAPLGAPCSLRSQLFELKGGPVLTTFIDLRAGPGTPKGVLASFHGS